jgi:hypothetical protein
MILKNSQEVDIEGRINLLDDLINDTLRSLALDGAGVATSLPKIFEE